MLLHALLLLPWASKDPFRPPQFPSDCPLASHFISDPRVEVAEALIVLYRNPLSDFLFLTFLSLDPLVGSPFRVDVD